MRVTEHMAIHNTVRQNNIKKCTSIYNLFQFQDTLGGFIDMYKYTFGFFNPFVKQFLLCARKTLGRLQKAQLWRSISGLLIQKF